MTTYSKALWAQKVLQGEDSNSRKDNFFILLNGLISVRDEIEKIKDEEGSIAMMILKSTVNMNFPDSLIESLTNQKAQDLINNYIETMKGVEPGTNIVFACLDLDYNLYTILFDMEKGQPIEFISKIPKSDGSFAGDIFIEVFLKKNLEKFAAEKDAVVVWEVTNFLCGL